MNGEERDGVQDEEGESRGVARRRPLNGEHQHDRSEAGDGRDAEGPELNRTRQEEEPTDQEAQPDEPAYHLVRAGTHGSVICAERISVEPRWTGELSRKVSSAPRRCARVGAGRSAEDRLLCKQEVLGSNPSRSIPKQGRSVLAQP